MDQKPKRVSIGRWMVALSALPGLLGPGAATLSADPALSVPGADAERLFAEAKAAYENREDPASARLAVERFGQAVQLDPRNDEALWRLARAYWWLGDHSQAGRVELYEAGKQAAERARQLAPGKTDGHFWYGVCLGRASETRGILNSLFAVDPIRKSMEKVLSIDPKHHGAFHVLGVLYRKVPGWPLSFGDLTRSLAYARQAVEAAPEVVLNHIGLAETLLALGRKAEAKAALNRALAAPGPEDQQPETREDKKTAEALLKSLN